MILRIQILFLEFSLSLSVVLGIEHRVLCMLNIHSIPDLQPQSRNQILDCNSFQTSEIKGSA